MTEAAAYYRVSSIDRYERYGLSSQEASVERYAKASGLRIEFEYRDVQTGRVSKGKRLQKAPKDAHTGLFEAIVVYDHAIWGPSLKLRNAGARANT